MDPFHHKSRQFLETLNLKVLNYGLFLVKTIPQYSQYYRIIYKYIDRETDVTYKRQVPFQDIPDQFNSDFPLQ